MVIPNWERFIKKIMNVRNNKKARNLPTVIFNPGVDGYSKLRQICEKPGL